MIDIAANPAPGINLVGFLEADIGLGEVARKVGRSLEHAGVPFAPIVYRRPPSREGSDDPPVSGVATYDTNIVCLNPDYLHPFLEEVGADFFARYTIGVWLWETSVLRPEDRKGAWFVDEVWVPSEYVRQAVAEAVDVPVHVVPLPIEEPQPTGLDRTQLGLPDRFIFLYVFDFLSAERKNPAAVVEAFASEFAPDEGPVLVLKSVNGRERKPHLLDALQRAAADRPDILIRDGRVSAGERDAYVAACDCYVSLHRSEGFGLTLAEAMAYGKPAIATGYSGNLEFMSEENAYLVPYRLVPVPEQWWAYAPGATWAEPDVYGAAPLMRTVYENGTAVRSRADRGREELLLRFSLERVEAVLAGRLQHLVVDGVPTSRVLRAEVRPTLLRMSQALSRDLLARLDRGSGSSLASYLRQLLYRGLWPYFEDQRRFEESVLDALSAMQRAMDDLRETIVLREASPSTFELNEANGTLEVRERRDQRLNSDG